MLVSQDSWALSPPLPRSCGVPSVPSPQLWLVDKGCLRRIKPRSLQQRKPTLKLPWTAPLLTTRPAYTALCGGWLGGELCPILLAHLCLPDPRMGPTPCLLTLTVLVLTHTQKPRPPRRGFCFILAFLLGRHPFVTSSRWWARPMPLLSVCSRSGNSPGFHSAVRRLCPVPAAAPRLPRGPGRPGGSSPATGTRSGPPGGSPPASGPGCRSRC